jgi:hypothetical protein
MRSTASTPGAPSRPSPTALLGLFPDPTTLLDLFPDPTTLLDLLNAAALRREACLLFVCFPFQICLSLVYRNSGTDC